MPVDAGSAEDRDNFVAPDGAMFCYRVRFYNDTPDSTGHGHHVCQLEVEVITASGAEQAVADAIAEFEKHQEVTSWRARAGMIESTLTGFAS
ncbi:hypothetical protein [Altericroceibacterium xinjiangense]|uniref:hypothetical protein n=1 Tax=Altericroceibacterium xinjiangense TaxID=762261 RepID=UPI000F7E506E|nr:hypothetical protein [Altericroceibacterium xinjiangense]